MQDLRPTFPIQRFPSEALRLLHPIGYVTVGMQHTPEIDMVGARDIEDKVRVTSKRPKAKSREVQLLQIAR